MPNYKQIYSDILEKKYPLKAEMCKPILEKENLSVIDILKLNKKIFGTQNENHFFNQKHRSYSKSDAIHILQYQKKHNLNNTELASHFQLSRNTVTKWKKIYGS